MNIGIIRGMITLTLFVAFILLWIWAWRKERRDDFDAAARLALDDVTTSGQQQGERS